ncbi:MAG: PrsW family glutamic-type intramembrane protease, partial [Candidatus Micrarchaeota archaeon]
MSRKMMCALVILFVLLFALPVRAQEGISEDIGAGLINLLTYVEALFFVLLYVFVVALLFVQETHEKGGIEITRNILTSKWFWLFEIFCGIVVLSLSLTSQPEGVSRNVSKLVFLIGGIGAFLPLAILLVTAFISNIYKKNMLALVLSLVLWGVFASGVALSMNYLFSRSIGMFVSGPGTSLMLALVLAPIFEEFVKGFGLVVLKRRQGIEGARMGILHGFCIGIGFSAMESWLYFTSVASPFALGVLRWTHVLVYRAVFSTLGHGYFTSALGASLGTAKEGNAMTRTAIGLACAAALHSAFNSTLIIP